MSTNRTIPLTSAQAKDWMSVSLLKVHNVGAGGVSIINSIDTTPGDYYLTTKRTRQVQNRRLAAIGWPRN